MKIYCAHHIWKYNTDIEKYELNLIARNFKEAEVINPNGFADQSQAENKIMKDCFKEIKECDALVFSSVSGMVGKGVHDEVSLAHENNVPVYYLFGNSICRIDNPVFEKIEESDSNRIYANFIESR